MKKLFLLFALAAFLGANTASKAVANDNFVKVECEKCGKDGKCTQKCKDGKKAKCCKKGDASSSAAGSSGNTASAEGEVPKSCAAKKACCKSKAKSEANAAEMKNEEAK